jgi:hypothetical protein
VQDLQFLVHVLGCSSGPLAVQAPSLLASAVVYLLRKRACQSPFWPSALAQMTGIAETNQPSFADVVQLLEGAVGAEEKGGVGAAAAADTSSSMGTSSSSSSNLARSSSSNLAAMGGPRACSPEQMQQASNSSHGNGQYNHHQQQQQQPGGYLSGLAVGAPGMLTSNNGSTSNLAGLGIAMGNSSAPLTLAGSGSLFASGHDNSAQGSGLNLAAAAAAGASPLLVGSMGGLQGGMGQAGVGGQGVGSAPGALGGVFGPYGGYGLGFHGAPAAGLGLLQGYEAAAAAAAYQYGSGGNLQHLEEAMGRRLL